MADVQMRALFLAAPDDEYEFLSLAEAEAVAGVEIAEDLRTILDSACLSYFLVQDGKPIPSACPRPLGSSITACRAGSRAARGGAPR
jgi:hypothetical protein